MDLWEKRGRQEKVRTLWQKFRQEVMKVMTQRIGDNVEQVEISSSTITLEDNCHYLVKLNLDPVTQKFHFWVYTLDQGFSTSAVLTFWDR